MLTRIVRVLVPQTARRACRKSPSPSRYGGLPRFPQPVIEPRQCKLMPANGGFTNAYGPQPRRASNLTVPPRGITAAAAASDDRSCRRPDRPRSGVRSERSSSSCADEQGRSVAESASPAEIHVRGEPGPRASTSLDQSAHLQGRLVSDADAVAPLDAGRLSPFPKGRIDDVIRARGAETFRPGARSRKVLPPCTPASLPIAPWVGVADVQWGVCVRGPWIVHAPDHTPSADELPSGGERSAALRSGAGAIEFRAEPFPDTEDR